ncbi:Uma2 family endonuclease [Cronbergia sp. UHCC 0137]|uniref:Uma2 family endonuclease n=1 Tax=Cronbergia sp. UHCC 0137 TaxID=3110239 RepID=UPI002B205A63|nr:Uma2 family endonuclease [Cronbergia sp. UHCC 0137]MEA5620476.1 Uma2 family endonuclease [Cronbergia sp. UHCC 0137]
MYQTDPPRYPKEVLPTMYDLPSEDPEEPGLPDQFHLLQPRLLDETFRPSNYPNDKIFTVSDMNLYYDSQHPLWHKRPDWFAVLGVPNLYENKDLRLSYVIWQEEVNPFIVIELLSPGTEKEDLGQTLRDVTQPPSKWQVYEQILKIPYYAIFDRYKYQFRMFKLKRGSYAEINLPDSRFWIPEIELGLGVWQGIYQNHNSQQPWLRWYDGTGNWVLTPTEVQQQIATQERQRTAQERQRAEQEKHQKERLIAQLRAMGIEPDLD